jgi:hypothetical protein
MVNNLLENIDNPSFGVHTFTLVFRPVSSPSVTTVFSPSDRPLPPGRAGVVSVASRSVTLSWTQPDDDGGCKIGNYIVEYYRVKWG